MIWRIIEPIFMAVIVILLFSQVVLPLFIGKPFFWFFKKSEKDLSRKEEELLELETELKTKNIEHETQRLKKKIGSKNLDGKRDSK